MPLRSSEKVASRPKSPADENRSGRCTPLVKQDPFRQVQVSGAAVETQLDMFHVKRGCYLRSGEPSPYERSSDPRLPMLERSLLRSRDKPESPTGGSIHDRRADGDFTPLTKGGPSTSSGTYPTLGHVSRETWGLRCAPSRNPGRSATELFVRRWGRAPAPQTRECGALRQAQGPTPARVSRETWSSAGSDYCPLGVGTQPRSLTEARTTID